MNKRKNNNTSNHQVKKRLIDSKDLERNVLLEISKELTNKDNKTKK